MTGTTFQEEQEHAVGKVGHCPFCRSDTAELWRDPSDDWKPFQVRCRRCDARGPRCDCGWESAVPTWRLIEYRWPPKKAKGEGEGGAADG